MPTGGLSGFGAKKDLVADLKNRKDPLATTLQQAMALLGAFSLLGFVREFIEIKATLLQLLEVYRTFTAPIVEFFFGALIRWLEGLFDFTVPQPVKDYAPASLVFLAAWLRLLIFSQVVEYADVIIATSRANSEARRQAKLRSRGSYKERLIRHEVGHADYLSAIAKSASIGILLAAIWPAVLIISAATVPYFRSRERIILDSISDRRRRSSSGSPDISNMLLKLDRIRFLIYAFGTILSTFIYFLVILGINQVWLAFN